MAAKKQAKKTVSKKAVGTSESAALKAAIEGLTNAVRENTLELKRHSTSLRTVPPIDATFSSKIPVSNVVPVAESVGKSSKEDVRRRLASATGNTAEALKDDFKVQNMMAGGPAVRDNLMSKINNEFWPGSQTPHLRFGDISTLNIGQLIKRIRQLL